MPYKVLKTETDGKLVLERVLHFRRDSLTLDRSWCTGCELCSIICPREAITVKKEEETSESKIPTVDIDEEKCHYCGMCKTICPFGAIDLKIDGESQTPVTETESFPHLVREIEIDTSKCKLDCVDCEEACPLDLIKVTVKDSEGKKVEDVESVCEKDDCTVSIDLDKDHCPCCRLCELKCPDDAISVKKIFHGTIKINRDKCPEDCQLCVDACPITGTLYLSEDGKVYVDERSCVYCGVCRIVCPEEDALELNRTRIIHTPLRSGAWNKALEKLASTKDMSKELETKSLNKLKESVEKRLLWRA
jgi:4Fe-4S ferredoxin